MQHYFNVKKNTAYRLYFTFDVALAAAPLSIVGSYGFSRISKDGGAAVNLTNAPVHVEQGLWYLDLTASEMNGDFIAISMRALSATNVAGANGLTSYTQIAIQTGLLSGGNVLAIPGGTVTIEELLTTLARRFKKNGSKI